MSPETFDKWFKVLMATVIVLGSALAVTVIWILVRVTLHYT